MSDALPISTVRATERWDPIRARWVAPGASVTPVQTSALPVSDFTPASPMALRIATAPRQPLRGQVRQYASARPSRFNVGLGASGNSSADAELSTSLTTLRAASRQVMRDASYAKRARTVIVNNVIGAGIGLQAQTMTTRGELNKRVNDDIETQYTEWCCAESCHTGGALHLSDLERTALGQVVEAGEALVRMHYRPFGRSTVPLALELIEAERLASELFDAAIASQQPGAHVRMGVEVDDFGRALAYWIRKRHPGDIRTHGSSIDHYERVPAADVFHLRIITRWPQTRGVPWLHTALRKLDSIDQYSQAELQAAQADAAQFATLETEAPDLTGAGALATNATEQTEEGAKPEIALENGMVQELAPGEKLNLHSPERPNTALDPFLRYMLREVAAGLDVSYESLSRDYSQSNYSSSRLALLDDRDTWRVLQQWWIRTFRLPLHKRWLQQAVIGRALATVPIEQYGPAPLKFEAVKFKPRGWNWVDPTKEVAAYKEAEKAGYISAEDIIAQTANGLDIEDVVEGMKRSRDLFAAAGIQRDTDVAANNAAAQAKASNAAKPPPDPDDGSEGGDPDAKDDDNQTTRPKRVVSLAR